MLTDEENKKVEWLLSGPVFETLEGAEERISAMSMDDCVLLCRKFNCSIDKLADYLYYKHSKRLTKRLR